MNLDVEKIVREYLDKTVHLSLGTVSGARPWVCEVHFAYDDQLNLYFVSLQTTRHCQEIAANPHVAGNIVKQHPVGEAPNGIYFEGEAVMIEPSATDIERYCSRLKRDSTELTALLQEANGRRMYRIQVNNWAAFGNFESKGNTKYELVWNGGKK